MLNLEVAHNKPFEGARFALYGRVSTPGQLPALEAQFSSLRNDVAQKKGRIVKELSDVRTGALTKKRAGYQGVLKIVGDREIDYLFVRDVSRLGRKFGKLQELWSYCRQNGVVILDAQVGIVTSMHLWALGMVAELMRGVQGEQVRASLAVKARDGFFLGSPPYGYECVEVEGKKGQLKVVPGEAKVVKRIFKRALDGFSLRAQTQILNFQEECLSPGGSLWSTETVRYILTNPVYRKDILWGRTKTYFDAITEDLTREKVDSADWIRALGSHTSLVSASDFDKVQAILSRNRSYPRKKSGPPVFLSGLLKCPYCSKVDEDGNVRGGTLFVAGGDKYGVRMRCTDANSGKCVNRRTFYRHHLLRSVLQGLADHLRSPQAFNVYLEEHNNAIKRRLKEKGLSRRKIEKRLVAVASEIKKLIDLMAKGINRKSYSEGITLREQEEADLAARLDEIENATVTFELNSPSLVKYVAMADKMIEELAHRRSAETEHVELREHLESLIQHVYVHPLKPKGFEVEVFGKLATLVTGQVSYRAAHHKSQPGKDILTQETLTVARAADKLVIRLPRKLKIELDRRDKGVRRPEPDLKRILVRSAVPLSASMIIERLAEKGVERSFPAIYNALDRRPELFVKIRGHGFMLRCIWEKQPLKYFVTTEEVAQMAQQVLREFGEPMRPEAMLEAFHKNDRRLYGNELSALRQVLSRHADFEPKGRRNARWILRPVPGSQIEISEETLLVPSGMHSHLELRAVAAGELLGRLN
jgi:DNA invertase Pin-like site-specific DNA recombinase